MRHWLKNRPPHGSRKLDLRHLRRDPHLARDIGLSPLPRDPRIDLFFK